MQKRLDLTELMQVRVSKRAKAAIEKAAHQEQVTVAAFIRHAVYEAAGLTGTKPR